MPRQVAAYPTARRTRSMGSTKRRQHSTTASTKPRNGRDSPIRLLTWRAVVAWEALDVALTLCGPASTLWPLPIGRGSTASGGGGATAGAVFGSRRGEDMRLLRGRAHRPARAGT